jgi:hypothetical protein
MRTLLAIALLAGAFFTGGLLAPHTPADSAETGKKRSVKPRTQTTVQPRTYSREEIECEGARHEDPAGVYAGFPCWAREAFGRGQNGGGDRQ